jgi:HEAT repeat protein
MDSERAVPILRKVLQEQDPDNACVQQMRQTALFLLAQHLDEESVDVLLDVIQNDPSPEMRATAVFWLAQVPGERTVVVLEEILRESDDVEMQQQALFALGQVQGERTAQILRDFALNESNDPELRGLAIFWIGQRADVENTAFLREVYATTDAVELRQNILHSVGQSGGEENARWLLQIASDPNEDMEMRKLALFWVGQSHELSVAELTGLYESMPDRELKEQIIFSVAQRHDEEVVDWLLNIARNERDPELRKTVIFWLSQSDDPRVAEFLLEIIEGGN